MIGLVEVQASLALFAEAIAGEPIVFVVADEPQKCWPRAPRDLAGQVTVPVELASRPQYRAMVLHQVLSAPASAVGLRSVDEAEFLQLFEMVEDHRVRADTNRRFPGAMPSLEDLLSEQVRHLGDAKTVTLLGELRRYCLGADRAAVGVGLAVDDGSLLDQAIDRVQAVASARATSADCHRVASEIWRLITGLQAGESMVDLIAELLADEEEAEALASEATTGVSLESGTPSEFVDSDGAAGGQLMGDIDEDAATVRSDDDRERLADGMQVSKKSTAAQNARNRTYVYDEWDYRAETHRRAWCQVTEEHLVGDDVTFLADVRSRHQALRSQIRRSLLRMPPQDLVRVYRCDDGEELDLDAAIEAMADRRSGAPVDDRLQIRRDRAARDVATAFLVDLSASTSSPAVPPEPEPLPEEPDPLDDPYGPIWGERPPVEQVRRVIDVAKDAVTLMGDALHGLGDRYAIYGFSGTGREGVEFKIGKDFNDRVTPASWAAVAEMKPLRYTRMGPAVRHAAAKLAAETARTKLLIVISDGYPQDTDYGYDRHDRDYGLHDTARALTDAQAAGIDTFSVTIDPAGHDYLRRMCPEDRYLVIDDVESLPEELARLYFLTLRT